MSKHLVPALVKAVTFGFVLRIEWLSFVTTGLLERIIAPPIQALTDLYSEAIRLNDPFKFLYAFGTSGVLSLTVLVIVSQLIVLAFELAETAGQMVTAQPSLTKHGKE
jgi:hypothetical protein